MLLKVNGEYLDFNNIIDIEKQSKLFEQIDTTTGDFSYSFDLKKTANNLRIFGNPFPDVSGKIIYQNVACDVIDEDGILLYSGQLRVQNMGDHEIQCSFFSGNYNWFSLLTGNVSDLDFSEYDIELNASNIINSTVNTDGLVFPLIDIGGLKTRSFHNLMVEDFNACMYVKTIFRKIFYKEGLKIKGELINDWRYNNLIIASNNKNDESIIDNSSYAQKTSNQTMVDLAAYAKILFQDDSTFPYYDGVNNNYASSVFTAPVKMNVRVEVNLVTSLNTQQNTQTYRIKKNASTFREYVNPFGPGPTPPTSYNISAIVQMNAGDTIQIDGKSVDSLGVNTGIQANSTLKITPIYIYTIVGNSTVPKWTKQQFVSNILTLFNVVSDYDPISKEITFNLFDKIKSKEPIDISSYISSTEINYEEFISNFSRNNILSYNESGSEDLKDYNIKNKIKYANAVIPVSNDFIEEENEIVSSDFTAPVSYINPVMDASIEFMEFITLQEGDSSDVTSVTNSSTYARFNVSSDFFNIGDLVRVTDSTNPAYNGDYVVFNSGGGVVFLRDVFFSVNATAKITKLNYVYNSNDNVHLLINIPNADTIDYSGNGAGFYLTDGSGTNLNTNYTYCYFNLLNTGRQINEDYTQGISFGEVNSPLFYQKTLLDDYWSNVASILNDPVKLISKCNFPKAVFLALNPLVPVYIKSKETTNLYYQNRITGYVSSKYSCDVELIKL